jgi:hypothetical protein
MTLRKDIRCDDLPIADEPVAPIEKLLDIGALFHEILRNIFDREENNNCTQHKLYSFLRYKFLKSCAEVYADEPACTEKKT